MKKNIAMPVDVWRSGDEEEKAKYGLQEMSNEEVAQRNQDELAHDEYMAKEHYKQARAEEYPSVGDQLEAMWGAIASLAVSANHPLPPATEEVLDKIEAVKEKYPKPKGKINNG